MTTNQTIDGVPGLRELLERLAAHCVFWDGHAYLEAIQDVGPELRALLDAPAKPVPSCVSDLERFEADGEDFVKVGDVIDMLGNMKAAQPQGEPIKRYNTTVSHGGSYEHVVLEEHKNGHVIQSVDFDAYVARHRHEQPAPVAVHPQVMGRVYTDNGVTQCELNSAGRSLPDHTPLVVGWSTPPENCRQRLLREGKPYPRSSCGACGQFSPLHKECDVLLGKS